MVSPQLFWKIVVAYTYVFAWIAASAGVILYNKYAYPLRSILSHSSLTMKQCA